MTARLSWPPPGKHTRIFQLSPAHLDELLRRKIARDDAVATRTISTPPASSQEGPHYGR